MINIADVYKQTIGQVGKPTEHGKIVLASRLEKAGNDEGLIKLEIANFLHEFSDFKKEDSEDTQIEYCDEMAETIITKHK